MSDDLNFETCVFLSSNKFIISVYTETNLKVYEEHFLINDSLKNIDFLKLDFFLNENIFKIEKKIKKFVNKVYLILDLDTFFSIGISIKKTDYDGLLSSENLTDLLYEAKNCCKKTLDKKKIIHMIIDRYLVNNKSYSTMPENLRCSSFSLDIQFICVSNEIVNKIVEIFKKYHISLNQIVSGEYIKKFLTQKEVDMYLITKKLINGHNPNEIILIDKTDKKPGFFEKFFNFFN